MHIHKPGKYRAYFIQQTGCIFIVLIPEANSIDVSFRV